MYDDYRIRFVQPLGAIYRIWLHEKDGGWDYIGEYDMRENPPEELVPEEVHQALRARYAQR